MQTKRGRFPSVQRQHPLNQDLVAWYLAHPWMFPGNSLYPLIGDRVGTLTNMAVHGATSGFGLPTRPGASGELRFDGTDDIITTPPIALPTNTFTLSLWYYAQPGTAYDALVVPSDGAYGLFLQELTGILFINYYDGDDHYFGDPGVNYEQWTHLVVVSRGTEMTAYLDGIARETYTFTVTTPTFEAFGNDSFGDEFFGTLDDIRLYSRALDATDVQSLYQESVQGYPTVLPAPRKRLPRRASAVGTTTLTITPARVKWAGQTLNFTFGGTTTRTVSPARIQWSARSPTLVFVSGIGFTLARVRHLATPRRRERFARGHPLNQGLVAWFLTQPWLFPGNSVYNLVGDVFPAPSQAVLEGMSANTAESGMGMTLRPLGRGELRFNGTTGLARFDTITPTSTHFTLSVWAYIRPNQTGGEGYASSSVPRVGRMGCLWSMAMSTSPGCRIGTGQTMKVSPSCQPTSGCMSPSAALGPGSVSISMACWIPPSCIVSTFPSLPAWGTMIFLIPSLACSMMYGSMTVP